MTLEASRRLKRANRAERLLEACEVIHERAQARDGESSEQRLQRLTRPIQCVSTGGDGTDRVTYRIQPSDSADDCEEPTLERLLVAYAEKLSKKT